MARKKKTKSPAAQLAGHLRWEGVSDAAMKAHMKNARKSRWKDFTPAQRSEFMRALIQKRWAKAKAKPAKKTKSKKAPVKETPVEAPVETPVKEEETT